MRTVTVLLLLCASLASSARAQGVSLLAGSWRLVSLEHRDGRGEASWPMGREVEGRLMYDEAGNMSAHLMRRDRPSFASGDRARGTDAEVRAAFDGYLGYFGRYTVDAAAGTVTHQVVGASYPNMVGRAELRHFVVQGDRLVLSTPPFRLGERDLVVVAVWERAR